MTQPNIFQEIEEDLEHQRVEELWRKFGPYVLGVAAFVVILTAGYSYLHNSGIARDQKATEALMQLTDKGSANPTPAALEDLAKQYPGKTQATFALLRAAALEARAGHTGQAISLYDGIAADTGNDTVFRQLATVLSIDAQMDSAEPAALLAKLQPLLANDGVWRAKALEDSGYLYVKTGDKDAARKAFTELAQDASLPRSMGDRAQDMLNSLGN